MIKMADNEVLTLNVGGKLYTTTTATLTRYTDSMLGAMFAGHMVPTRHKDTHGHYFIDRDGDMFAFVLQYLRSDTQELCLPASFTDYQLLKAEADYYQIPGLAEKVEMLSNRSHEGHYIEILDYEEVTRFSNFYSDPPPRGENLGTFGTPKTNGLVLHGDRRVLLGLPLPERTRTTLQAYNTDYCNISITSNTCCRALINERLLSNGGRLISDHVTNSTDSDGSYSIHKYLWFVPAGS